MVILWKGCCVHWPSARQAFIAQWTCEAELISTLLACNLGDSIAVLLSEMYRPDEVPKVLRNGNQAAIAILVSEVNSWRTRDLRIRAPLTLGARNPLASFTALSP